jgi:hypothetical protein
VQVKQISSLIIGVALTLQGLAQDRFDGVVKAVTLDSVTVVAVSKGFSVEDFISMVQADTSFFQAFRNLRLNPWWSENDIEIYDRRGDVKAKYLSSIQQPIEMNGSKYCRWNEKESEDIEGKFFNKKGEHLYYTSELFWYLFYTEGRVCEEAKTKQEAELEGNELRKQQLKTLIFNPGAEIEGVPFIKKRMAIFHPKMVPLYDYSIQSLTYGDSMDCYVFTVSEKDSLPSSKINKVVIKNLVTWFSKADFSIVSRQYELEYYSSVFDFSVIMDVKLRPLGDGLIVDDILYDGFWDIPFRKPERARFKVDFNY